MLAIENSSRPRCVLTGKANVDAAGQVRRRKVGGIACVQNLRAGRLKLKQDVEAHWIHFERKRLIERWPLFAVQHRIVIEVGRSVRLIGGHHLDECFFAHGLKRVVRSPLLSQSGYRFFANRLATKRTRAMRRVDQACVWKPEQLGVQRIEQHAAQFCRRPAERRAQVGPPHVTDKESVSSQHGVGLRIAGVQIVNDDGNGLGSVARRFQYLEAHTSEFKNGAVTERCKRVSGLSCGAEVDGRARAIAQLQMAGNKIGVEMREKYVLDF